MIIGTYPKRLIEVDLPIKRISEHARREKSIRHGHISTLHIWWARRPLAACRAVICAALWPDPADPLCPPVFRDRAAKIITGFAKKVTTNRRLGETCSQVSFGRWLTLSKLEAPLDTTNEDHLNVLRFALLDFIADFANWDNSTQKDYMETSRTLTQVAHEALGGLPGTRPLVVDPFAGGGSIPLEALRVGADAFASDLNPVAVLLNKVVLEYIPKYGQRLADEVRKWGKWIKQEAEKELAEFYPKDPDGATPIAYLWARTIKCEGPGCGAEVPLIRSVSLARRPEGTITLEIVPDCNVKSLAVNIGQKAGGHSVGTGTVRHGAATCPVCEYTTPVAAVRRQLEARTGGTADARLLAVVTRGANEHVRSYRVPTDVDLRAARRAADVLQAQVVAHSGAFSLVPDERTPPDGTGSTGGGYRTRKYGIARFCGFHTPRQLLEQVTLRRLVRQVRRKLSREHDDSFAQAVHVCLSLAADKQLDRDSAFCRWISQNEAVGYTFGRQAVPMLWDFVESPGLLSSGGWAGIITDISDCIKVQSESLAGAPPGDTARVSATQHILPDSSCECLVTDPPYYDSVPYAELSDFFLVWMKRTLVGEDLLPAGMSVAPRNQECVVNLNEGKDRAYFQRTMTAALSEGRRVVRPNGLAVVVFAHKSTSGWEAQLQALIDAGWLITGSWPIDTERPGRLRALHSAALASSIHLVCRPRRSAIGHVRPEDAGDLRDVLAELPKRIHEWMPRLAQEGVAGADAIFSCLGPALEVFSRYSRVEKASGEQVSLREYLEQVWAAVAKEALNMIFAGADATGFEEDSRVTAMWLWTLSTGTNGNGKRQDVPTDQGDGGDESENDKPKQVPGGYVLEFDAARKIAQGLGAHLERLASLVEVKGEIARLLPVAERTRHLFGKNEGQAPSPTRRKPKQLNMFDTLEDTGDWGEKSAPKAGATVLDRLHQSMILFAAGRSEALRRFLMEDGAGQDQRFWRLAQALSALYPSGSDEKRWVDGVLARKKSLGF